MRMRLKNEKSGPKGLGLGLPPDGTSILFPPCGSLLEWWSNGVMEGPIQLKLGLSFLPTLQHSNIPVLQKSSHLYRQSH